MSDTLTNRENEKATVRFGGDVVAASLDEYRGLMRNLIGDGVRDMVLDFENVRMLDSRGIGLLISAHNSLKAAGGKISLTHASEEIVHLLQTMRVHQHFSVSGS
jgi:anti-anti-sigma factor